MTHISITRKARETFFVGEAQRGDRPQHVWHHAPIRHRGEGAAKTDVWHRRARDGHKAGEEVGTAAVAESVGSLLICMRASSCFASSSLRTLQTALAFEFNSAGRAGGNNFFLTATAQLIWGNKGRRDRNFDGEKNVAHIVRM